MEYTEYLEMYAQAVNLPIRIFKGHSLEHFFGTTIFDFNLPLYLEYCLPEHLPAVWFTSTPEQLYFGGLTLTDGSLLMLGPVFAYPFSHFQLNQLYQRLERGIHKKKKEMTSFTKSMEQYPLCNPSQLTAHLRFLYLLLHQKSVEEIPLIDFTWSSMFPLNHDNYSSNGYETDSADDSYVEQNLLSLIRYGKVKEIPNFINLTFTDIDSGIDMQSQKSYMVGSNFLMARTAQSAGADVQQLNLMSSDFIEQINHCNQISDLRYLFQQIATNYAQIVANLDVSNNWSILAKRASNYIQGHIYDKLSTSIIAKKLGVTPNYLCAEFKKQTGSVLTDYIKKCKILEACHMIDLGGRSIGTISILLGFSTSSYFSTVFKEFMGCTPSVYKQKQLELRNTQK